MESETFWTSGDGQILSVKDTSGESLKLEMAFWPHNPKEWAFMREKAALLRFTERSILARIGIDIRTIGKPTVDGKRLILKGEAILFDSTFPNKEYWKNLLKRGTHVGRLFYAPAESKLTSEELWCALESNLIKLPNSMSIDSAGRVFLKPHAVHYTLSQKMKRSQFERLVTRTEGRAYLDRVQVRHDTNILTIKPHSGVLTSCSMYLKEHYVVLNQGEGNFGIHCGSVVLDPIKTFGSNIMLEIYNHGDQPVVNPVVSVDIYKAHVPEDPELVVLKRKRERMYSISQSVFEALDKNPPKRGNPKDFKREPIVIGTGHRLDNNCLVVKAGDKGTAKVLAKHLEATGHRTVFEALEMAPEGADTVIMDYFPNLAEHIEMLTRLPKLKLSRIIFRNPSRNHGFFLSNSDHARLEVYEGLGVDVHWYNLLFNDLFIHTYKKNRGYFVRDEMVTRFQECTIMAFYGSSVELEQKDIDLISELIDKVTGFFGGNLGVLTGGGPGVMSLAIEQGRQKGALTGGCFLELEAQPPSYPVDFFNTFQETARHNRQKWFEVADFCIFNVGGVGTLEEIGIEMCNLKLGVRPRMPFVFFNAGFWNHIKLQLEEMVKHKRVGAWLPEYILFTDEPAEVVEFYRKKLQVL